MAAIKKFFEKRKLNVKFKKAGEGHRLDQSSSSTASKVVSSTPPKSKQVTKDPETETARRAAAEAALARMEIKQQSKNGVSHSLRKKNTFYF